MGTLNNRCDTSKGIYFNLNCRAGRKEKLTFERRCGVNRNKTRYSLFDMVGQNKSLSLQKPKIERRNYGKTYQRNADTVR